MPAAKEHRLQDNRTNGLKTIITEDNGKTAADRQKSSFFLYRQRRPFFLHTKMGLSHGNFGHKYDNDYALFSEGEGKQQCSEAYNNLTAGK